MSLKAIWLIIQTFLAGLGGWFAAYLGGMDGLIYALIIFVDADYLTGVLRTATIFFYLFKEGISLLENATRLGLLVPAQIRFALDAITRSDKSKPPLTDQSGNIPRHLKEDTR